MKNSRNNIKDTSVEFSSLQDRSSDSLNEDILNSSPDIIFTKNLVGEFTFVNKCMVEFIGIPRDQLIGETDRKIVANDNLIMQYEKQDHYVLSSGKSFKSSPQQFRIKGKERWYQTVKSPLFDFEENIIGVLGVVTDVSELMHSKELIKEQDQMLSTVYNSGSDFIIVLRPEKGNYYYVSCNKLYISYLKAFGLNLTSQDLADTDMLQFALVNKLFTPERAKTARTSLDKVLSSKETYGFTDITQIPGKGASYVDMEMSPILDEKGTVNYIVCRGRDFSELMRYNKQLQEREELLNSINRNVQDGIFRSTAGQSLKYVNDSMARTFGYSVQEMSQISPTNLYHDSNEWNTILEKLSIDGSFSNREILFVRKDQSTFWGLISCSMTIDSDGSHLIDGIIVDVTEDREVREILKATNDDLRKTNSELDHLVYRTSHDLRSPIASAMGLCELLRLEGLEGESKDFVSMLEGQLSNLDKIIVDIINIRKIAKTGLLSEQIDIASMVNEILGSFKFLENFRLINSQVKLNIETEFYQDSNQIRIVLNNLISNAIKYIDHQKRDPKLEIHVDVTKEEMKLVVVDNGIGISDDHVERVFEMFYRATAHNTGTGLGLFIVKEAIDKLGGTVRLSSAIGEGTTFCLFIPNRK